MQRACRRLATEGVIKSAHDCSDGGLAIALAESCIAGGLGVKCDAGTALGTKLAASGERWDAILFGEAQSRIIVSLHRSG